MSDSLTTLERSRLSELEASIERSLTGAARNIAEIRDARLYRESHPSFEAYCRERWGIGRAHAYRLIGTAKAEQALSPMGDIRLTERVARELPREPEQAQEVWQATVERHGDKPTAAQVREVRTEVAEGPAPRASDPVVHQMTAAPSARPAPPRLPDPHALINQMSSAIDAWTPLVGKEAEIAEQAAQIEPDRRRVLITRLRQLANVAEKTERALTENPGLRVVG